MGRKENKRKTDKKTLTQKIWLAYLFLVIFTILFLFGISIGMLGPIPAFEELENPKSNLASEIITTDGELLGKFYIENRTNIEYFDLPEHLVNALIATEDVRFHKHSGVDGKGLFRVLFKTILRQDKGSGGGSTLTQQLAKNLFERPRNISKIKLITIKLREWITSAKLEKNYSKEEILTMYLNTVDFGHLSFGIQSASQTYFGKSPDSLSIEESATLVGMLKAPTFYSPIRNPERSTHRRNVVLSQMKKYDYITQTEYDSLKLIPMNTSKFQVQDHTAGMGTYLREYLRKIMTAEEPFEKDFNNKPTYYELKEEWDNNPLYGWVNKNKKPDGTKYNIYKDGLKIYTTIDSRMQKHAEESVYGHVGTNLQPAFYNEWKGIKNAPYDHTMSSKDIENLLEKLKRRSDRYYSMKRENASEDEINKAFNTPKEMTIFSWKGEIDTTITPMDSIKYYQWFLQAGFVAIDPHTGYVKAYVGGINYKYFKFDHASQAKRQVGSTFKPFVYALAVRDLHYSPCTKVPCVPVTINLDNGQTWTPKNSGGVKEGEMVTLKYALASSVNWISAYLIKQLSPQGVIKLARNMGIKSPIPEVYAIALGVPELTLMEMVGAQTTYPNKGIYTTPILVTHIEDKSGNTIQSFMPNKREALNEETAYVMLQMMKGVVDHGTGARIRGTYNITYPIAGKTGTTDNNSDGWFMGLTPDLVAGAWVGCQVMQVHFRTTARGQGANTALPIWANFIKKVYNDPKINISKDDFFKPHNLTIEVDCEQYDRNQQKGESPFE